MMMKSGAQDGDREADAVLEAAPPAIITVIGARHDELVDQIAFRAHHLDTIIAGLLGQGGASAVIGDGAQDVLLGQRTRGQRRDRRADRRRRHRILVRGIAAGMQDLQRDLAPRPVHGVRHGAVMIERTVIVEAGGALDQNALAVGRDASGDDQADSAGGAGGIEGRQLLHAVGIFLEAGMHRAHQHPIFQLGETEIEGGKEMGIGMSHLMSLRCTARIPCARLPRRIEA